MNGKNNVSAVSAEFSMRDGSIIINGNGWQAADEYVKRIQARGGVSSLAEQPKRNLLGHIRALLPAGGQMLSL